MENLKEETSKLKNIIHNLKDLINGEIIKKNKNNNNNNNNNNDGGSGGNNNNNNNNNNNKQNNNNNNYSNSNKNNKIINNINSNNLKENENIDFENKNNYKKNLLNKGKIKIQKNDIETFKSKYNISISRISEDFRKFYDINKILDSKEYYIIYEVIDKINGEKWAIKVVDINKIRSYFIGKYLREANKEEIKSYIFYFFREISYMKTMEDNNNENTIKYYEYFHTKNEFAIVTELYDYNLLHYFIKKNFNIDEIREILSQLNKSFKIISKKNIIHGLINLENIYVKNENKNQIYKLGICDNKEFHNLVSNYNFYSSKVQALALAPEILENKTISEEVDLWSIGILIYVLYFKEYPFKGKTIDEILENIKIGGKKVLKKSNDSNFDDLIRRLLTEDPGNRIKWEEYFYHPFLKNNSNFRDNYIIENKIGDSDLGTIYKGKDKNTQEDIAIKIINRKNLIKLFKIKYLKELNEKEISNIFDSFYKSIENMKRIIDENKENNYFVKLYEYFYNNEEIAIIMELCDDNLLNLLIKKTSFNSDEIKHILYILNNSLNIMIKNKLDISSINLENILIKYENKDKKEYIVKFKLEFDFPLLKGFNLLKTKINQHLDFISPEILGEKKNKLKSNLWSIGILIYVLYFKEYPFKGHSQKEILKQISQKEKLLKKTEISELDDLIQNLLIENPSKRLSWEEYFKHPFFKDRKSENFRNYYEIIKTIGESKFTIIYKAKLKESNELRCIKIYDLNKIKRENERKNFLNSTNEDIKPYVDKIYNEINNMKIIEEKNKANNNIVKLYEYFNNKDEIAIVMELCDDNLLNILVNKELNFDSKTIYEILNQLNNSFRIINEIKLIQRNLNLENIMIKFENKEKSKYTIKLKINKDSEYLTNIANNHKISLNKNLNFIAPEILRNEQYNEKCDLWSLGIIIYVLYFKEYPYTGASENEVLKSIERSILKNASDYNLNNLIMGLLSVDQEKRFNWEEYFSDSFFDVK